MSQTTLSPASTPRPIARQIAIIVLAVISGLVHLYRSLMMFGLLGGMGMRGPRSGVRRFSGGPPPGAHPGGGGPGLMGMLPVPLSVLFLLNFVGYIVLAAALYLPALERYRQIIRWVLLVYALVTIILWYLFTGAGAGQFPLGYGDKVVEVALIVLLLFDMRSPAQSRG
jgi:hypothetical protein